MPSRRALLCSERHRSPRQYRIKGEPVHPKGRYVLRHGDEIVIIEPGGGGFGNPWERKPEAVTRDVLDGAVSREAARREYGIEIDAVPGAFRRR